MTLEEIHGVAHAIVNKLMLIQKKRIQLETTIILQTSYRNELTTMLEDLEILNIELRDACDKHVKENL